MRRSWLEKGLLVDAGSSIGARRLDCFQSFVRTDFLCLVAGGDSLSLSCQRARNPIQIVRWAGQRHVPIAFGGIERQLVLIGGVARYRVFVIDTVDSNPGAAAIHD